MTFPITKTSEHTISVGDLVSTSVGGESLFPTYLVTSDGAPVSNSNPVPISDAGGSITVDGTVGVSGSVAVTNAGTFAVQAAQSGTWNIANISGTVSLPTGAATSAKQPALGTAGSASSDVLTVQGIASMTALKVDGSAVTQPVSGTFWQATQPVSVAAAVAVTDNSGSLTVDDGGTTLSIDDGAGSITVDGTVAVSGTVAVTDNSGSLTVDAPVGTPVFVRLSDGASAISTLPVSIAGTVTVTDGGSALTVENNGTFAVQSAQSGTWTVGLSAAQTLSNVTTLGTITNVVHVDDNSGSLTVDAPVSTPVFVRLSDGASAISTLPVSLASSVTVVGAAASGATKSGNPVQAGAVYNSTQPTVTTGQAVELQATARGGLIVATGADTFNVTVNAALPAGTNAIGKLAANSGVTIGAVEIAASQTLATVTTVSTVTTCSTVTTLTGGGVAHDGVDSGNPVKVGAKASSAQSTATMVSSGDRTDATSDLDGSLLVRDQFPLGDLLSERVTDTGGTSTAFSNFGATASTRNYVTAITVFNSSATAGYVDFRDGTGGSVLYTIPLPAGGGAVLCSNLPLFRTSANTALAYDVSAALSTVYISISGFKSKV